MPSPYFNKVVTILGRYVPPAKATDILNRHLTHCNVAPDSFSQAQLPLVANRLIGAITLYLPDERAREAFTQMIRSM